MNAHNTRFTKITWSSDVLAPLGLPSIDYPVPFDAFPALMESGGDVPFEYLLVWMMQYAAADEDWQKYDDALLALMAKVAPPDDRETLSAEGEDFWLEVGPVDLEGDIVTVQRQDRLIAAMTGRPDGRLRICLLSPPEAKTANYLLGLSRKPGPNGLFNMRETNWQLAVESTGGFGSMYAADAGVTYLSRWEFGLGISMTGEKIDPWFGQRQLSRIPSALVVGAIGTCYALSDPD